MDASLIRLAWRRAGHRCEYCRIPQDGDYDPFEIDHIIALKHVGPTAENNLALACLHCNAFKGPNIAGLDPKTRNLTPLFNPRRHKWARHFRWRGGTLLGRTAIGRVTIAVLNMNDPFRVELREQLMDEGFLPPA